MKIFQKTKRAQNKTEMVKKQLGKLKSHISYINSSNNNLSNYSGKVNYTASNSLEIKNKLKITNHNLIRGLEGNRKKLDKNYFNSNNSIKDFKNNLIENRNIKQNDINSNITNISDNINDNNKAKYLMGYITCRNKEEAHMLAQKLVAGNFVACCNIFDNITSFYKWNNNVEFSTEYVLIVKAIASNVEKIISFIKANHSYNNPAIVFFPIVNGSNDYLKWLQS